MLRIFSHGANGFAPPTWGPRRRRGRSPPGMRVPRSFLPGLGWRARLVGAPGAWHATVRLPAPGTRLPDRRRCRRARRLHRRSACAVGERVAGRMARAPCRSYAGAPLGASGRAPRSTPRVRRRDGPVRPYGVGLGNLTAIHHTGDPRTRDQPFDRRPSSERCPSRVGTASARPAARPTAVVRSGAAARFRHPPPIRPMLLPARPPAPRPCRSPIAALVMLLALWGPPSLHAQQTTAFPPSLSLAVPDWGFAGRYYEPTRAAG